MTEKQNPLLSSVSHDTLTLDSNELIRQLSGRFASLFMICYQRRDVSGIHISLTAFTHSLHALNLWAYRAAVHSFTRKYILVGGFPENELYALDWLLNHYFDIPNENDESLLLNWYQSIDDEWVLRKKLRGMFPDKKNSELTLLIAAERDMAQVAPEQQANENIDDD